jgi:hypothetical protein
MTHTARVFTRFEEWWDATMADETFAMHYRSPDWWAEKFLELRSLAARETCDGFELRTR